MKKILAGLVAFALTMGAASAASFLTLGNQEEKPTGLQSLVTIVNSNFTLIATGTADKTLPTGMIEIGGATSNAAAKAVSGDITITTNGVVAIGARRVTSGMIPALPTGQVLVGGATSNATGQTLQGVITCDVTGLTAFVSSGNLTTNTIFTGADGLVTNVIIFQAVGAGHSLLKSWTITQ